MSLTVPAIDRLDWASQQADDPYFAAQAKAKRCRVLMYVDSIDVGFILVDRRAAPQQTRLHPHVRETLRGIADAERRSSDSLVSFASWVGVPL